MDEQSERLPEKREKLPFGHGENGVGRVGADIEIVAVGEEAPEQLEDDDSDDQLKPHNFSLLLLPPSAIDDPFNNDELFRSLVRYKPVDEWVFYFWLTAPFFLSRLPNLLSKGFFFFRLCGFTGEVFVFPLSCFSIEDTPFGWSLFSWTSAFGAGSSSCTGSLSGDESFSTNLKLSDVLSSASTESLASFSSLLLSSFSSLLLSVSFSSSSLAPMAFSSGLSLELLFTSLNSSVTEG
nr:hypothetical protein Iba_chr11eCG4700 [Ipomoea batatas]